MTYSLKMVGKHTILSLFRIFSALSIWENRPEWVYIIPVENNLTHVSGILKWNVVQSIYWIFLALVLAPASLQSRNSHDGQIPRVRKVLFAGLLIWANKKFQLIFRWARLSTSFNLTTKHHCIMKDNGVAVLDSLFYNFKLLPSECVAR